MYRLAAVRPHIVNDKYPILLMVQKYELYLILPSFSVEIGKNALFLFFLGLFFLVSNIFFVILTRISNLKTK
jgi:hypothetical protein